MLSKIRAFLTILDEGSVRRAAALLNMSQPALSRQMQALEHEVGGRLLERSAQGVLPTAGGLALAEKMRPLLSAFDTALAETRQIVRGHSGALRLGYLNSAGVQYVQPAIIRFRQTQPEARLQLLDLTPAEQAHALRKGALDLALTDHTAAFLAQEFYSLKLCTLPLLVAVNSGHPLAQSAAIRLAQLRHDRLVCAQETTAPGSRHHLERLCLELGGFRPTFASPVSNLDEVFDLLHNEDAIAILPGYMSSIVKPCIKFVPLSDENATAELLLIWRRGTTGPALQALIEAFRITASQAEGASRKVS
ncbi:MAG: LysR family transcriptional regulator [Puniceicoccaceae bacterium 5H]|nr:MAG: LysR family transcriptional regulator [Puniceicoccaceae bacterium 5H]